MGGVEHLVLIDGHHAMYRAYWAIPRTLTTSKGEQVNTVFGVASMLLSILKLEQPTYLVACFDAGEETFRHQENKTYKEGRADTPDDFYTQIPRVLALIDAFGFAQASHPKYEADDFLCTYAKEGERAGMRVTIVTGDRDALQLANATTRIAIPRGGFASVESMGPEEIEAKYGIRPEQVPEYKGLMGDASDNLPGVKGIGPKTAAELLQTYETLDGIYEHLGDIRPAVRAHLERDREQAYFCARMAQLVCDVPLAVPLERAKVAALPAEPVLQLFSDLEFTMLSRRFREVLSTPFGREAFYSVSDVFAPHAPPADRGQMPLF